MEEEEKKRIDLEEARYQAQIRKEIIEETKTQQYHQTDRVKGLHSALRLAEVLKEREAQIELKRMRQNASRAVDREILARMACREEQAVQQERQKALQRKRDQLAISECLKLQVKEHDMKKEQERRREAEEMKQLRDLHLREQAIKERQNREVKRKRMNAFRDHLTNRELTKAAEARRQEEEEEKRKQIASQSEKGERRKKLEAKTIREAMEEEEKKRIDLEEARYQAQIRKEIIEETKTQQYHQTDRVKGLHSALRLAEVLKEREAQIELKRMRQNASRAVDREILARMACREEQAVQQERQKALQRKRDQLAISECLKLQVKEHDMKKEQERRREAEEMKQLRDLHLREQAIKERQNREVKRKRMNAFRDHLTNRELTKAAEARRQEEEEEKRKQIASQSEKGERRKKLEAKTIREAMEEEEKKRIDLEEARYQAQIRKEIIEETKTQQYHQTDRVKGLHSALRLAEVLKEREAQIELKRMRQNASRAVDREILARMAFREEQAVQQERQKALQRKRDQLAISECLKLQVKEHDMKKEQERRREAEEMKQLRDLHLREQAIKERQNREVKRKRMNAFRDHLTNRELTKAAEARRQEEEEEKRKQIASQSEKVTRMRREKQEETFRYFVSWEMEKPEADLVLSRSEWQRVQDRVNGVNRHSRSVIAAAEQREALHMRSKELVKHWPNTIAGERRKKLEAKTIREAMEEEEKKRIDLEEARYQAQIRKEIIEETKTQQYHQTDRVKGLHSALRLAEVLKEREAQIELKRMRQNASRAVDREILARMACREEQAVQQERQKALQRKRDQLAISECLKLQVKEHDMKKEQERRREAEEMKQLRDLHLREQAIKERQNREVKRKRMNAFRDHLTNRELTKAAEARRQEEEEEKRKQIASQSEKVTRMRREKQEETFRERQRHRETVIQQLAVQKQEKISNEEDIIAKAVAEREARRARVQREKEEKHAAMLKSISAHRESRRQELERKAEEEKQKALEMLNAKKEADQIFMEKQKLQAQKAKEEGKALQYTYIQKMKEIVSWEIEKYEADLVLSKSDWQRMQDSVNGVNRHSRSVIAAAEQREALHMRSKGLVKPNTIAYGTGAYAAGVHSKLKAIEEEEKKRLDIEEEKYQAQIRKEAIEKAETKQYTRPTE
ncbi:trichohyalin-like [Rhinichthys klamathensis goyatoka]|uniref:trichohyalin-like n=1 Tax=Rhinichthys klamathensis goyatoka TaxID=3034132 RepID=UPI0024B53F5A|nr:trichohyalin-like [Rhinichthys klamathensis goyatoka]